MKIFILNMSSQHKRLAFMAEQMERLGLEFEVFPAICGKDLSTEEKSEVYDAKWGKRYEGREFTDGEIGCALSHLRIYEKIRDEKIDAALILEDDCWLTPSVKPIIECLENDKPWDRFDVVVLSGGGMKGPALWTAGTYFIHEMTGGMFAHAYIVTNDGAKKMTKKLFPIRHFADSWTWMIKHDIAKFAAISPIVATQDQFSYGSATSVGRSKIGRKFSYLWFRYKAYRLFWKTVCNFID